jgi:hypothetical protein
MSDLVDSWRGASHPRFVLHDEDGTCVWLLDVPYPRTFMAWLRQQVNFPGRIHDLARDVVADLETATFRSAKRLRLYLEEHGHSGAALETLDEAVMVWNVTYGAHDEQRRQSGCPTYYKGADASGSEQL